MDAEGVVDGVALAAIKGIGCARYGQLLDEFGSAAEALQSMPRALVVRARNDAIRTVDRMRSLGGVLLCRELPGYPPALLDLADPPPVLYALGDPGLLRARQLAIVGTRSATQYGLTAARELARAAVGGGLVVTSGLARGIDAAAHAGALDATGGTIAVLGTGVDIPYPRQNIALYREVVERGLVISELPPGERADAGSFPRRNRIIAALAPVTLVVQAGFRSGALITAGCALDIGRTVAAVPGPIDVGANAGSNALLRDGAHVITAAVDLIQLAGGSPGAAPQPTLTGPEAEIWWALAEGPADLDTILARTGLPARDCAAAAGALELAGLVAVTFSGELRRAT